MDFYVDKTSWPNSGLWARSTRSPILQVVFNRGSTEPINVRFVDNGSVVELGSTASVGFGLKSSRTSASWLITPVSATKSGTGSATVYALSPQFLGTALDILLDGESSTGAVLELYWVDSGTGGTAGAFGTGSIGRDCRVYQNLNTGGENVPTSPAAWTAVTPTANGLPSVEINPAGLMQSVVSCIVSTTGSYTYKIVLLTTGVTSGALVDVYIQIPTDVNAPTTTVEVRNASLTGTIIHSIAGDSSNITYQRIGFRFNGTAWVKFGPGELA